MPGTPPPALRHPSAPSRARSCGVAAFGNSLGRRQARPARHLQCRTPDAGGRIDAAGSRTSDAGGRRAEAVGVPGTSPPALRHPSAPSRTRSCGAVAFGNSLGRRHARPARHLQCRRPEAGRRIDPAGNRRSDAGAVACRARLPPRSDIPRRRRGLGRGRAVAFGNSLGRRHARPARHLQCRTPDAGSTPPVAGGRMPEAGGRRPWACRARLPPRSDIPRRRRGLGRAGPSPSGTRSGGDMPVPPDTGGRTPDAGGRIDAAGGRRPEAGGRIDTAGGRTPDAGGRIDAVGSRTPDRRRRRSDAGGRRPDRPRR